MSTHGPTKRSTALPNSSLPLLDTTNRHADCRKVQRAVCAAAPSPQSVDGCIDSKLATLLLLRRQLGGSETKVSCEHVLNVRRTKTNRGGRRESKRCSATFDVRCMDARPFPRVHARAPPSFFLALLDRPPSQREACLGTPGRRGCFRPQPTDDDGSKSAVGETDA